MPLIPKEDTAASRDPSRTGHSVVSVGTNSRVPPASICGFQSRKCRLAGTMPWRRDAMAFSRPATPDTGSVWPMFVFTEPSAHRSRPLP
ncbi:hypothetical protein [Streptomyces sp. CB03238]|uniref:hypothetical protein n=1 Tax=Streptomyces sp. CB03238 TaxID=1907777 RepID=UPI001F4E1145|nr:hypothetical protein [Streptomyces sp. CB03238]